MTIRVRTSRRLLLLAVVLPAVLVSGCSSPAATTTSPTSSPSSAAAASLPTTGAVSVSPASAPSTASQTPVQAGALTGKWSGTYSGAFSGTFELTWIESSGKLAGTIDLSTSGKLPLNGTVTGSAITFGTVGSTEITYTGTVSGDTMAGSYTFAGSQTGSWSAHRAA